MHLKYCPRSSDCRHQREDWIVSPECCQFSCYSHVLVSRSERLSLTQDLLIWSIKSFIDMSMRVFLATLSEWKNKWFYHLYFLKHMNQSMPRSCCTCCSSLACTRLHHSLLDRTSQWLRVPHCFLYVALTNCCESSICEFQHLRSSFLHEPTVNDMACFEPLFQQALATAYSCDMIDVWLLALLSTAVPPYCFVVIHLLQLP